MGTRARTVADNPSLLARIDRAIYRLGNTHGLPLQPVGDTGDPEIVPDIPSRLIPLARDSAGYLPAEVVNVVQRGSA